MNQLRDQKGMALLLVLAIVALLTALLTEFSFSTLVDLRATETFRDRAKAYYLARGGIEAAGVILQLDKYNEWDHPSEFWGDTMANIPAGDGDVSLEIEDLTGRLNLNTVASTNGVRQPSFHRFVALCEEVLQINYSEAEQLGDALVNWFNADLTKVTPDDSYYAGLNPPYRRKGGKLNTVDELLLLRGFDQEKVRRLKPFVRVVGEDKINVNTASAEVLYAWQFSGSPGTVQIIFDDQDIAALLEYRQQSPFLTLNDLSLAQGIGSRYASAWILSSVSVLGTHYRVISRGRVNDGERVAEAVIQKSGNKLLSLRVE